MKKILLLLLFCAVAFADVNTTTPTSPLLSVFQSATASWRTSFVTYALYIFYVLTIVDLVINVGFSYIKGNDYGEIYYTLIRTTIVVGFFLALFQYSDWLSSIPSGFSQIADKTTKVAVDPDKIMDYAIFIVAKIWQGITITKPGDSLALAFAGIVLLIAFGLLSAQLFMAYVKNYTLLSLAPLAFSLGGLTQTRQMAFNPIFAIIKSGMELMLIKMFLALTITTMDSWANNIGDDNGSIMVMILTSVVMVSVVHMTHGMVESILSGSLAQSSTAGMGTAQAVMGGIAAGGMAGVGIGAAVKAANALAKEQRAAGDGDASTWKNFRHAAMNDIKRGMAGENRFGNMGGRMAYRGGGADSLDVQKRAQSEINQNREG